MFLSRLCLNPRHKQVRKDLANSYEMHRTLEWAVSDADERLLWRLEPGRPESPILLVQTRTFPRWDRMLEHHPCYAHIAPPKQMDTFINRILRDPPTCLRFRLRANAPVKRLGKRHALFTFAEKLAWLERQGARHGFELLDAVVVGDERLRGRKEGTLITLDATLFEGYLRVVDPQRMVNALEDGIGHAKSFGLGLLSVAPIRS